MPYPMEDEEPQVTFSTSWGTQPSVEAFTEMLKDCERMVRGQHEGGVSAYEPGTALELLREQEHAALRPGDVVHTKDEKLTVESIVDGRVHVKEGGFVWPVEILDVEPAASPSAGTQPVPVKPIDVSFRKTYPGDPAEWPRVSDESVMPNSDEAKRQRARFLEAWAATLHPSVLLPVRITTTTAGTADVSVAGPSCSTVSIGAGDALVLSPDCEDHEARLEAARVLEEEWAKYRMWYYGGYAPWTSVVGAKPARDIQPRVSDSEQEAVEAFRTITSAKAPTTDTRCPRVDADTGIQCMHEAGTPHAHETPAGKPIFSEHSGPRIGEYRVTGFGVTLDLPVPPNPICTAALRRAKQVEENLSREPGYWPKSDIVMSNRINSPRMRETEARLRGAGAHLAALHQDTLNRPFYKGRRVRT